MTVLQKTAKVSKVDRALSFTGYPVQFDPPLEVVGKVVERANFLFERLCVEFTHEFSKYTVWKDLHSGEVEVLDQ